MTMTPVEVFEKTLELVLAHDMQGYAGLWAEDGSMEFPFAIPGATRKLDGRAAIAEYLKDYTSIVDVKAFPNPIVHLTADPEVIVVEFAAEGVSLSSERPHRMPYVGIIRMRHGEIMEYRDYWNHAVDGGALAGFTQ